MHATPLQINQIKFSPATPRRAPCARSHTLPNSASLVRSLLLLPASLRLASPRSSSSPARLRARLHLPPLRCLCPTCRPPLHRAVPCRTAYLPALPYGPCFSCVHIVFIHLSIFPISLSLYLSYLSINMSHPRNERIAITAKRPRRHHARQQCGAAPPHRPDTALHPTSHPIPLPHTNSHIPCLLPAAHSSRNLRFHPYSASPAETSPVSS